MSLLTKASLVATPTAYDGGVLNSVKPTNRENLLLQSNQFDTTWVKGNSSVTGGQSGYDGSSDAWKIDLTGSGGQVYQSVSYSGINTFSVYLKAGTLGFARLLLNASPNNQVDLNLTTGATALGVGIVADSEDVGGGWFRFSITGNITSGARVYIYPAQAIGDFTATSGNIYIQDAQLQKGITATQYVETTTAALENGDFSFARASSATRVNEQGYIEKERENLLLQSNQFDTTWVNNLDGTITGGQAGYDGTNDAWLLTKGASSYRRIQQTVSGVTGVWTMSAYLKTGTATEARFRDNTSAHAVKFNFNNNTSSSVGTTAAIDHQMTDVGNGWFKCSATFNASSSVFQIYVDWSTSNATTLYIQDAQLEVGLIATDYIETTTSSVAVGITNDIPRINYENGIGNFLLEPQRTNNIIHSEYFQDSSWTPIGSPTIELGYESPDGNNNAVKLTRGSNSTPLRSGDVATIGSNNSFSIYAKAGTATKLVLDIGDEGETEFDLTSEWQRFDIVVNPSTYRFCDISMAASSSSGDYFYIYGAQCEAGASYPTSYIPCYGAATTRAAETCNNAGNSDLFNDSEGVLYAEFKGVSADLTSKRICLNDGTTSNRVSIGIHSLSSQLFYFVAGGGSTAFTQAITISDTNIFNKCAVKYKSGDSALWVNGVEVDTKTTTFTISGLDDLSMTDGGGLLPFYGKNKMVSTFTEALSDSELECLTSWSSFNRMATAQNYNIE